MVLDELAGYETSPGFGTSFFYYIAHWFLLPLYSTFHASDSKRYSIFSFSSTQIVIIENVFGAPWDQKVKIFADIGYSATYLKLDTKDFYIPHTRQRGYLFAIRKPPSPKNGRIKLDNRPQQWKNLVNQMKRPASATLDAFLLSDDDPRVLRGRARLTAESASADHSTRAGRTDWTKCETRHLAARSLEELGDQRPLTGWSDSGNTTLPGHFWYVPAVVACSLFGCGSCFC